MAKRISSRPLDLMIAGLNPLAVGQLPHLATNPSGKLMCIVISSIEGYKKLDNRLSHVTYQKIMAYHLPPKYWIKSHSNVSKTKPCRGPELKLTH